MKNGLMLISKFIYEKYIKYLNLVCSYSANGLLIFYALELPVYQRPLIRFETLVLMVNYEGYDDG